MKLVAEGIEYQPTHSDVLWLKRAVEAEGEPRVQVAQTLLNKFMWARARLGATRSLADFVRAYASPVNPAWYVSGDRYKERVRAVQASNATPAEKKARVDRLKTTALIRETVHSTRLHFRDETERAVEQALRAGPDMPTATDYSAWHDEPDKNRVPLTPPRAGENRFYRVPGSEDWPGYSVLFGAMPALRPDVSTALWVLLGIAIYAWSRHGKR